jgi:type VI secretion system protein ImpA
MTTMLDVDLLLQPVSVASPGGENLEYSPEFAKLESALAGQPERQMGEVFEAAQGPDWNAVVGASASLLRLTKDLRLATHLARGLLATQGPVGFASGLAVLRGLVEQHWPVLHPALDADDGDATARLNAVADLAHQHIVVALCAAPLATSKELPVITLKDVEALAAGTSAVTAEVLQRALPAPVVRATLAALATSGEHLARLIEAWGVHVPTAAPDFSALQRALLKASAALRTTFSADAPTGATEVTAVAPVVSPEPVRIYGGAPRSREEVLAYLEGVCSYYARAEPASPVRQLIERCRRLVPMSFPEVVNELCPEGLSGLRVVLGRPSE